MRRRWSGVLVVQQRREGFDAFVTTSADRLTRAAYLVVGDLAEAEDLAQEALVRAAARWPRVRRMANPYGYTRKVLFHLALEEVSRRHRHADRSVLLIDPRQDDPVEDLAASYDLSEAMTKLPRGQRATLVLRYWEQLSEAETAEALGCSVGTVKSQTSKAIVRLRGLLADPARVPTGT